MRELGIKAIWVSPYKRTTIDPDFDSRLKNILDRNFDPKAPNTVWVTDITYIHTLTGFVYLTSVMDLYSRAIVGWHLSDSLSTAGVVKAIENSKRNSTLDSPVIIHSDRPNVDHLKMNYYKGVYYDEVLKCIGENLGTNLNQKYHTLDEIKKMISDTKQAL